MFGLIVILFVFGIKYRRELPEGFKRVFGTGMLPIIFINLFIGFVGRSFIGNAAHLGGLFAGALLALVVDYRRPGARASISTAWRALQVLASGGGCSCGVSFEDDIVDEAGRANADGAGEQLSAIRVDDLDVVGFEAGFGENRSRPARIARLQRPEEGRRSPAFFCRQAGVA